MISGVGDKTAWEACCHCEGGESDSSKGDFEGCALIPGWVDQYGMSCGCRYSWDVAFLRPASRSDKLLILFFCFLACILGYEVRTFE